MKNENYRLFYLKIEEMFKTKYAIPFSTVSRETCIVESA
jgi:hypothetical protein